MAYFPNASAGEVLDAQCADCPLGFGWNDKNQQQLFDREPEPRPCPVAFAQLTYNYEQFDKQGKRTKVADVLDLLVSESGECMVRKELVEIRKGETS